MTIQFHNDIYALFRLDIWAPQYRDRFFHGFGLHDVIEFELNFHTGDFIKGGGFYFS